MDVFRSNPREQAVRERKLSPSTRRALDSLAMMAGVAFAFLLAIGGGPLAVWGKTTGLFSSRPNSELSAAELSAAELSETDLDHLPPQKQAELLLDRAVSHSAADPSQIKAQIAAQIESRSDAWRGQLQWDSQLGDLTTVALNSNDLSVRASAIEVQLAAYGLAKTESTVEAMARQADSRDHRQKIWALWALGLLGNRGVEPNHVVQVLTAHLKEGQKGNNDKEKEKDKDEDTRRWAVEGLALVGTTPTIAPLLETMHNDPSPVVREHAACSLAQSGMLSREQRLIAVPQLIAFSADPALDAQTRAWAFQALADITGQHLPNDSAAWRGWYQTSVARG
ncbi:MAG: HEAT repeat domain-containing protein, partial [Candidatus Sulfotelmatobacter sp.]